MKRVCVIGSGPSGVSAAHALLAAGAHVTMFDAGNRIEPEMRRWAGQAESIDAEAFRRDVHESRKRARKELEFVPDKLPFGSAFAYRPVPGGGVEFADRARFVTSYARGGLSTAWGANINRLAESDIDDWPIRAAALEPYFDRLQDFVSVSGEEDGLDSIYAKPLVGDGNYVTGPQGEYVLATARPHLEALAHDGLLLGRAKLAVGPKHAAHPAGCIGCGLCMHGCPYGAIFNAAHVVERELLGSERFALRERVIAESFTEAEGRVEVSFRDLASGQRGQEGFDRLYIGAGVIGSTALVARSLGWLEHTFRIQDSQKYIFGWLLDRRIRGAMRDRKSELSQVYLQSRTLPSSSRIAQGQLYGYNDLLLEPIRKRLGPRLAGIAGKIGSFVLERFMIGFLYLHSDVSGHMDFDVAPLGSESLGAVRGTTNPLAEKVRDEFFDLLRRNRARLGGRPSKRLQIANLPGNSQHFGSSLPMRADPQPFTTDLLGRPFGCSSTHVVDCSVLPSITGTPPTYTAMANAVRIADLSLRS